MNRSITTIFHDPATGCYGYSHHFPGLKPHCTLATCATLQDALDSCDPHREFIWEEASDADEGALLVSRTFKQGSVAWRMANLSLGELAAQRAARRMLTLDPQPDRNVQRQMKQEGSLRDILELRPSK